MRKRKLVPIILGVCIIFIITTIYLLSLLAISENEVRYNSFEELIFKELNNLNEKYTNNVVIRDDLVDGFINTIKLESINNNLTELWDIANSWVGPVGLIEFTNPAISHLYYALRHAKIIRADIDKRGTQLKFLLTLEGGQTVIFKPKWYDENKIIEGPVYGGKDRYFGEIIAFYLSVIFHKPFTPFSTQRTISFTNEILPVATKLLLNTSFERDNKTCVYGKCFYCTKKDPICGGNNNNSITGAVIFNLNYSLKSYRSPWQRSYKKNVKVAWQETDNYCRIVKAKLPKQRLLDLIDTSVFDFLIQNGDRHHYETLFGNVIMLDNGKSFGNPNQHHLDILAPLYQCCLLRTKTTEVLETLKGGNLRRRLTMMPDIDKLINEDHIRAMEQRLLIVYATMEYCKNKGRKAPKVLQ